MQLLTLLGLRVKPMKEDCKLVWVKVETCCRNSLYVHGEYSLNFSFRLVETDLEKSFLTKVM